MGSSLYAYLLFVKKLDLKMLKCIIKKLLITPMSAIYICKNFRIVTSDMRLLQTKIANESQENEISTYRLFKSLSDDLWQSVPEKFISSSNHNIVVRETLAEIRTASALFIVVSLSDPKVVQVFNDNYQWLSRVCN